MSISSTTARFFATVITSVGLLMMTLFGLCGAIFIFAGIGASFSGESGMSMVAIGLGTGILPAAIGFAMFWIGRRWVATFSSPSDEDTPT